MMGRDTSGKTGSGSQVVQDDARNRKGNIRPLKIGLEVEAEKGPWSAVRGSVWAGTC